MKRLSNALILLFLLGACTPKPEPFSATPYDIDIPFRFPTQLNIPDDNPMTEEGVALGRCLFYDGRLSGWLEAETQMSCASCHHQERNFKSGGMQGFSGETSSHAVMPLTNVVWNNYGYGWNGGKTSIEEIVCDAVCSPHEIGSDTNRVKALLQATEGYPEMFYRAFGSSEITFVNVEKAIAQFVRSLVSGNSRFDQYLRGEVQLTPQELNGYVLFITEEGADCFHCHGGGGNPLFTTNQCVNNGLDSAFVDPSDRSSVTGQACDKGSYKVPSLRNVEAGAPYMHDGRFSTLDEVIDFYSENVHNSAQISPLMHHVMQGGVQLTPTEKADLKAFLFALTDTAFLNDSKFSKPVFPDER